jgi:glycosyltransferase involved in cell wall biosynthesis
MHILFVLHQFFPEFTGGTERVGLNLARMAQRAGHRVHVLACQLGDAPALAREVATLPGALEVVVEGVPVTLLDRRTIPTHDSSLEAAPALLGPLQAWLQAHKFDLVHAMHTMRMGAALMAAQRERLPLVLSLTDYFVPCFRVNLVDSSAKPCEGPDGGRACATRCSTPVWPLEALQSRLAQGEALLRQARWCVAPSKDVARRYQQVFPQLRVQVIPHGVDLLKIMSSGRSEQQGERPLTLGFVGTLIPLKGLHILLSALASHPEWPVRLLVAGVFHDDAYAQELQQTARSDARVQWLGRLAAHEVHALMHSLDLLCLPSLVPESFSLVVSEAAAAGVPALVSDLGAPAQAVARSGAGAVVPAGQPQAWAQALQEWINQPALRAAWRQAVRLPLRIEEEAFLYESLYRDAMAAG